MNTDSCPTGSGDANRDAQSQRGAARSQHQTLQTRTRFVAGCMTGTSIDGIDVAVVRITGTGLSMSAQLLAGVSMELDGRFGDLSQPLRDIAGQRPVTAGFIADVSRRFSLLHAHAAQAAARKAGVQLDLVVLHGQTVWHRPPVSWQLCSPAVVAHELNILVVGDLRAADLAAGGQGAPITPLADWILFGRDEVRSGQTGECTAIVNLGGFANYTMLRSGLGPEHICAGDICVCNQLLDTIARATLGQPFDENGAAALRGAPNAVARADLAALCDSQSLAGRSLGTGDEVQLWLETWSARLGGPDLCASACAAIGSTIGRTLVRAAGTHKLARTIAFGGGAKNLAVLRQVGAAIDATVGRTSDHQPAAEVQLGETMGIGIHEREAACMAVLGALSQDGVAITLPQVTKLPPGIAPPVAGVWCGVNLNR